MGIMFTNFVGIDVSKSKFDLALIKGQDKDHVIQGVFDNTLNFLYGVHRCLWLSIN